MNSRKNSYGTAASPLFPRFPLNPRSTIFVSYSLPSFPSPRSLPSLTVFSASPTLCVSSSRGNAYKKKFVAQKVLLHFFANNSLEKRRERDKEKNRLLVPGNLDRPRDFFPCAEEERNELSPKRINEGALSLSRRVEVNGRQTSFACSRPLFAREKKGRDSAGRQNILSAARLDARGIISQPAYRGYPSLPIFLQIPKMLLA